MKHFIIPRDDGDMGAPAKTGATITPSNDGFEVTVPEGTLVVREAAE